MLCRLSHLIIETVAQCEARLLFLINTAGIIINAFNASGPGGPKVCFHHGKETTLNSSLFLLVYCINRDMECGVRVLCVTNVNN